MEHESAGRPVTPPGGLALGGYEVYRNQLKKDRVREYRQSLLKVIKQRPSVSLDIPIEKYLIFFINLVVFINFFLMYRDQIFLSMWSKDHINTSLKHTSVSPVSFDYCLYDISLEVN